MVFLLFFVSAIVLLLLCLIFLSFRKCEHAEYVQALEDVLKVGGAGMVVFDARDELKHANARATKYLEILSASQNFTNLQDFISYIFDHASDEKAGAINSFGVIDLLGAEADFHEVVIASDGNPYLVKMYKMQTGNTIVLIRNVSVLSQQSNNLHTLNQRNEELSLAIEAVSCGVFILDATTDDMNVRFMNRMCRFDAGFENALDDDLTFNMLLSGLGRSEDFDTIFDCVRNQK